MRRKIRGKGRLGHGGTDGGDGHNDGSRHRSRPTAAAAAARGNSGDGHAARSHFDVWTPTDGGGRWERRSGSGHDHGWRADDCWTRCGDGVSWCDADADDDCIPWADACGDSDGDEIGHGGDDEGGREDEGVFLCMTGDDCCCVARLVRFVGLNLDGPGDTTRSEEHRRSPTPTLQTWKLGGNGLIPSQRENTKPLHSPACTTWEASSYGAALIGDITIIIVLVLLLMFTFIIVPYAVAALSAFQRRRRCRRRGGRRTRIIIGGGYLGWRMVEARWVAGRRRSWTRRVVGVVRLLVRVKADGRRAWWRGGAEWMSMPRPAFALRRWPCIMRRCPRRRRHAIGEEQCSCHARCGGGICDVHAASGSDRATPTPERCTYDGMCGDVDGEDIDADGISTAECCCAAHGTLRVGEATNPGHPPRPEVDELVWREVEVPRALDYPRPGKQGFHGVHAAGFKEEVDAPPLEPYTLSMATVNVTGWEPLQNFLLATTAEVVFTQEHRLPREDIPMASSWARRHGWKSLWAPAVRGGGGGWSAGTGILVRDHIGLRRPDVGPAQVCDGRVIAAMIEAPSCRPILGYSAYLHHGRKLGVDNVQILADIGAHWESQGSPTLLFAIGADFNIEPAQLTSVDLDEHMGGRTVAPRCMRGTCRTRTSSSTLDYFYMSAPLSELVETVSTVEGTNVKTHVPVMATFYPRPAALKSLTLRDPPPIPLERVYGPLPAPPTQWRDALKAANALCNFARNGGDDTVARSRLDDLYATWANLAEQELCDITATKLPKRGCRSSGPSLVWKPILPERGAHGKTRASKAAAWSWVADVLRDCARMCPVDDNDDVAEASRDEGRALGKALLCALREEVTPFDDIAGIHEAVREAVRLVRRGMRLCQGGDGSRRRHDHTWLEELRSCEASMRANATEERAEERRGAAEKWREWVRLGVRKGARNAHLVSRLPQEWRPSTVELPDGRVSADPAAVLEGQRDKFARLWAAADTPRRYAWTRREALERLTPSELREASSLFRQGTATTYDGFACRHFALLSDQALEVTGALLEACELLSTFPSQVRLVSTPLLDKPKGGHRPVSIYPALYRLWTKARRGVTQDWEHRHLRPFFSAAAGNGPADTVWRQQLKQETKVMSKGVAVSVLWDLEAFFERIDRQRLHRRAAETEFPLPLLRLALDMYSAPKIFAPGNVDRQRALAYRGGGGGMRRGMYSGEAVHAAADGRADRQAPADHRCGFTCR